MHLLKQSTAATVIVGPVLDSAGAAVTTAVVGDFRLAKEGTSAVLSGATVTHDANGYYLIALTSTNTNTVGRLAIYSNNTAQSMGTTRFMVLLASVYDALVTNAVNQTGGLPAATAQITALAGAISTFAGGAVASVTGNVGGNVSGSVNSVVERVTANTDQWNGVGVTGMPLPTTSYTAPLSTAETAAAVWDAALATYTTADTFGARVVRSTNSNNEVQITGSSHVAADIHELQPAVITAGDFAADWLTAAGLASDAVTKIQSGLATSANQVILIDRVSYALTALVGACSDAQTAAETYTLSIGGNTFTVDYSGLDASGNRSTTTLSKA